MAKTFEELLNGRKLHELTESEIDEIVQEMTPQQLEKFDKELKKKSRQRKAPSKAKQKNIDDFNKALFGNGG